VSSSCHSDEYYHRGFLGCDTVFWHVRINVSEDSDASIFRQTGPVSRLYGHIAVFIRGHYRTVYVILMKADTADSFRRYFLKQRARSACCILLAVECMAYSSTLKMELVL
jgi:hypothetical protein